MGRNNTDKSLQQTKQPLAQRVKKEVQRSWPMYVMLLPAIILALIFCYAPMGGLVMAFQNYKPWLGITGSEFVGLDNFKQIFEFKESYQAIINTFIIAVSKMVLGLIFPIIVALLLNEVHNMGVKKGIQTLVYLPHFLSWVVAASIFMLILSAGTDATGQDTANMGFINALLCKVGILDKPIDFLTESKCWRSVWYIMNRWKETGWGTIIYLAALSGISPDLYEAAEIDGANRLQQIWNITIPAIMNTILVVFILNLAKVMNVFESVFVLYNSLVYDVSDVIQTYTYRVGIVGNDYGYSTAIGLFKSVISLILVTASDVISKKVRGYGIV